MQGQTFIKIAVVSIQQSQHTVVFPKYTVNKQFNFLDEIQAQISGSCGIGKYKTIRTDFIQLGKLQPLIGKIGCQSLRFWIGEHAPDLSFQNFRLGQVSGNGQLQQFFIGQTAPEKKRKAGGQIELTQRINRTWLLIRWRYFGSIQKVRADQHSGQRQPNTFFKSTGFIAPLIKLIQGTSVFLLTPAPVGPHREIIDYFLGTGLLFSAFRRITSEDSLP